MSRKSKKKDNPPSRLIRGTYYLSKAGVETDETRSLILRRRLQILVHSCIYYELGESIIPDYTWGEWAKELVSLQKKYPKIAERVDYAKEFKDFDGSTGFHLPLKNEEVMNKANYLLKLHKEKDNGNSGYETNRADSRSSIIRLNFSQ